MSTYSTSPARALLASLITLASILLTPSIALGTEPVQPPLAAIAPFSLSLALEPGRGQPVIDYHNTIVSRDGEGLPVGNGSAAEGKLLYAAHCAACHGVDGNQQGNALVGGRGSLATPRANKTVGSYWPYATTLYDYVARAMPYGRKNTLSVDEVYAVVAYVLLLNQVVPTQTRLDQQSLPQVIMPNHDGFIELQPK